MGAPAPPARPQEPPPPHLPVSYPFTAADLARLQVALGTLLSPVAGPDGVDWPTAAVRAVREAVSVGDEGHGHVYYVRGTDPRPLILHTSYSPALVESYSARDAPADEASRRLQERALEVAHPLMVMARGEFFESAIYREFFRPHGIGNFVGLFVPGARGPGGPGPGLRLSINSPALLDETRLERAAALMRVLHPAFRAGAQSWRTLGGPAAGGGGLVGLLDALEGAVAVCDRAGRVRHENAALGALLAAEPPAAAARVRGALAGLARAAAARLLRPARAAAGPDPAAALGAASAVVRAGASAFALHAALAPEGVLGEPAVLVTVRPVGASAPRPGAAPDEADAGGVLRAAPPREEAAGAPDDAARLRARFGLTSQELAVARLMAERRTDAEIAAALGISPNTVRTHAERVRRKLGVARRTEVAAALGRG